LVGRAVTSWYSKCHSQNVQQKDSKIVSGNEPHTRVLFVGGPLPSCLHRNYEWEKNLLLQPLF